MIDYHTHTSFSDDCNYSIDEMIQSAINKGIMEYAITDHHDPDYPLDRNGFLFELDEPAYLKAVNEAKEKYNGKIRIVKGIELGIQMGSALKKCRQTASYPYDFIIGSFHLTEYKDISEPLYEGITPEETNLRYYEYMLNTIQEFIDFDVLGHINAIDRYTDYVPDFKPYEEIVYEILQTLISHDRGIEINTSSFRYKMTDTMPSKKILEMYRGLGGKIITFGSDAHTPSCIGHEFNWAMNYLKNIGFDSIATFKNRTPMLVPIRHLGI